MCYVVIVVIGMLFMLFEKQINDNFFVNKGLGEPFLGASITKYPEDWTETEWNCFIFGSLVTIIFWLVLYWLLKYYFKFFFLKLSMIGRSKDEKEKD